MSAFDLQACHVARVGTALGSLLCVGVLFAGACAPAIPAAPPPLATAPPSDPSPVVNVATTPLPLRLLQTPTPLPAVAAGPATTATCSARASAPSTTPGRPETSAGQPVPGGWYFPEAGGFSIRDDEQAALWSAFQAMGGWPVLGYPVSRRFAWHGRLAQATQRTILEWSPRTGTVELASLFDQLHDEGLDDELFRLHQIPLLTDMPELNLPYETIAARRLAWLDERPAIKSSYCSAPGGADPVFLWGLPTSPAVDVSNNGSVFVLRSERAAFQEWVHGAPWAAPGEVTVVLAGDVSKEFNLLPAAALEPEARPT